MNWKKITLLALSMFLLQGIRMVFKTLIFLCVNRTLLAERNRQQCFYADYQYRSFAHCKTQKKADFHTTGKASKRVYILFCFGIFAVFHKGSNGG